MPLKACGRSYIPKIPRTFAHLQPAFTRFGRRFSQSSATKPQNNRHAQNKCTKPQKYTTAATIYINRQINIFTDKAIAHHSSDAPSTTSIQKLGDTRTRVSEAEMLPICPVRSYTIMPDSKRRHRNCLTCRHNSLARVGIFTSEFTSQNIKFIAQKLYS